MELNGKRALVTGGAHRIGKAIAMALVDAGVRLAINYHSSEDEAAQTVEEIETMGGEGFSVQADIGDGAQVEEMAGQIERRWGGLDILVNSADYFGRGPFPSEDLTIWNRVINTTINGSYFVSNRMAPMLLAQEEAAVVNILDLSAFQPWPNFTAHAVAKSGLLALTRQMALEMAPSVRVNAIAPGPVLPPPDFTRAQEERTAQRTLLKRWGTPRDVSDAALYLLQANYVTANVIFVDGGERYGGNTR